VTQLNVPFANDIPLLMQKTFQFHVQVWLFCAGTAQIECSDN
jgi:hypothetical protein